MGSRIPLPVQPKIPMILQTAYPDKIIPTKIQIIYSFVRSFLFCISENMPYAKKQKPIQNCTNSPILSPSIKFSPDFITNTSVCQGRSIARLQTSGNPADTIPSNIPFIPKPASPSAMPFQDRVFLSAQNTLHIWQLTVDLTLYTASG